MVLPLNLRHFFIFLSVGYQPGLKRHTKTTQRKNTCVIDRYMRRNSINENNMHQNSITEYYVFQIINISHVVKLWHDTGAMETSGA